MPPPRGQTTFQRFPCDIQLHHEIDYLEGIMKALLNRHVGCLVVLLAGLPWHGVVAQDLKLRSLRTFVSGEKSMFALAVDSRERLVAIGGADNMVSVFDLVSSKKLRQWQPSPSVVVDLAFAPGRPLVASASYPNSLTLFDVQKSEQVWKTQCTSPPTRIAFSPDGKKIGVASMVGRAMIYDAQNGKLITGIKQDLPASNGVAFSPDGKQIYIGQTPMSGKPGRVRIVSCDVRTGDMKQEIGAYEGTLSRLRISPSGRRLVTLDREGTMRVWNLAGGQLADDWKLDVKRLMQVWFMDDDMLVAGSQGQFQILKVGQPDPIKVVPRTGGVNHVAPLTTRGVLVAGADKSVHLFAFDKSVLKPIAPLANGIKVAAAAPKTKVVFGRLDNQPPQDVQFDGLLSPTELSALIGKPIMLKQKSGLLIFDAVLESMQFDRGGHGLRFLKYKLDSGRSVTVKSAEIYAMRIGRGSYALRYYPPANQLFLFDTKKANEVATGRLAASNQQLRRTPEEEEQTEATNEHKKFLSDAAKTLKDVGDFRTEETESTLIFTDLPGPAVAPVRRFIDATNGQLNRIFGIPQGDSVWRGKAVLAVFSSVTKFAAFEEKVMNNPNHGGRGGVRESAKRFLQTAVVRQFDANLARGLCWGYSLGFSKRLHSDAKGVPWLNMGIANVMQFSIVPDPKRQAGQRTRVIDQLKRRGSLFGLLKATRLEQERWLTCGQIVQFLMARDPLAFGQMFRDVKLGVEVQDALQQNYGMRFDDLAREFGASIGLPQLTP